MFKLKTMILLVVTASLAACNFPGSATLAPTQDVAQTLDAARTQAAQTVEADIASRPTATLPATATLAATATELPSPTAAPSFTPVNTLPPLPTATNTRIPATPTITPTSTPSDYNCSITTVSPAANTEFAKRADFDGRWTVKNTGTQTWLASDVDYRYVSGEKMQKKNDVYDLPKDVKPGESVDIIVDMLAPDVTGTFKTAWGLARSDRVFCNLNITIVVK